jgi:hypothetical protein
MCEARNYSESEIRRGRLTSSYDVRIGVHEAAQTPATHCWGPHPVASSVGHSRDHARAERLHKCPANHPEALMTLSGRRSSAFW